MTALKGIIIGISILGIIFIFGLFGLGWQKFFLPKQENIKREVFEQTQSFIHGKTQDLAKYYEEYTKADDKEKEAIKQIIIIRFAELDATKLTSPKLRTFLESTRGF